MDFFERYYYISLISLGLKIALKQSLIPFVIKVNPKPINIPPAFANIKDPKIICAIPNKKTIDLLRKLISFLETSAIGNKRKPSLCNL